MKILRAMAKAENGYLGYINIADTPKYNSLREYMTKNKVFGVDTTAHVNAFAGVPVDKPILLRDQQIFDSVTGEHTPYGEDEFELTPEVIATSKALKEASHVL